VGISRICSPRDALAELKRFCQGVITVQNSEITQYQRWLKNLRLFLASSCEMVQETA
jgi:uncharacterized protein (DUF305 family)